MRVSLDSVLDVSTGKRPWRSSFASANPDISAGPEPDFGRRACHSYVSDAERRKRTEGQLQSAQYLHRELPVRLAHAVMALDKVGLRPERRSASALYVKKMAYRWRLKRGKPLVTCFLNLLKKCTRPVSDESGEAAKKFAPKGSTVKCLRHVWHCIVIVHPDGV